VSFSRLYANSTLLSGRRRIHGRLEFLIRAHIYVLLLAFALILVRGISQITKPVDRPRAEMKGRALLDVRVSLRQQGRGGKGSNLICGGERGYAVTKFSLPQRNCRRETACFHRSDTRALPNFANVTSYSTLRHYDLTGQTEFYFLLFVLQPKVQNIPHHLT